MESHSILWWDLQYVERTNWFVGWLGDGYRKVCRVKPQILRKKFASISFLLLRWNENKKQM